jgi:hypothetical protein
MLPASATAARVPAVAELTLLIYSVLVTPASGNFIMVTVPPLTATNNNTTANLTLALLTPQTGKLGFEENAAAATIALKQALIDGYLPGVTIK